MEYFEELWAGSEESELTYTLFFGGSGAINFVSGYYENFETNPKLTGYAFREDSSSPWAVSQLNMNKQAKFEGNPNYMPVALRGLNASPSTQRKNKARSSSGKDDSAYQKQDSKQQRADEKVGNLLTDFPAPCKQYLSW